MKNFISVSQGVRLNPPNFWKKSSIFILFGTDLASLLPFPLGEPIGFSYVHLEFEQFFFFSEVGSIPEINISK